MYMLRNNFNLSLGVIVLTTTALVGCGDKFEAKKSIPSATCVPNATLLSSTDESTHVDANLGGLNSIVVHSNYKKAADTHYHSITLSSGEELELKVPETQSIAEKSENSGNEITLSMVIDYNDNVIHTENRGEIKFTKHPRVFDNGAYDELILDPAQVKSLQEANVREILQNNESLQASEVTLCSVESADTRVMVENIDSNTKLVSARSNTVAQVRVSPTAIAKITKKNMSTSPNEKSDDSKDNATAAVPTKQVEVKKEKDQSNVEQKMENFDGELSEEILEFLRSSSNDEDSDVE